MWTHGYGAFPPFPIFPIVFLLIIIAALFFIRPWSFRHWHGGGWGSGGRFDQGESILRERYARGEIDAEEYRVRKDELNH